MTQAENIAAARAHIYTVDLEKVCQALSQKGWHQSEIHAACELYRNYLFLRWKYPDIEFPPSEDIDAVWKIHILHTEDYRKFCEAVFTHFPEKYLDHYFEKSPDVYATQFENVTQKLYENAFGCCIERIRNKTFWEKCKFYVNRIGLKWLSAVVIVSIFSVSYTVVTTHNNAIEAAYNKLENAIRNFSYDEEDRFLICSSDMKTKYPQFYIKSLYETHLKIRTDIAILVNQILNMYNQNILITSDTYKELFSFSQHGVILYELGMNLCHGKIRNFTEIKIARKNLIASVLKSKKRVLWSL